MEIFIVDNQDPDTTCPKGFKFEDCPTAQELFQKNQSYRMDSDRATADGNYVRLMERDNILACKVEACGYVCHIALEVIGLKPSGNAKLYCRPPSP